MQIFGGTFKQLVEAYSQSTSAAMFYNESEKVQAVLCMTTFCRTEQLIRALAFNLVTLWPWRNLVAVVLVSFNDEPQGARLRSLLVKHFRVALSHGVLIYLERNEDWDGWHASYAKNTSHFLACEAYPDTMLVNVDGDSLATTKFCE